MVCVRLGPIQEQGGDWSALEQSTPNEQRTDDFHIRTGLSLTGIRSRCGRRPATKRLVAEAVRHPRCGDEVPIPEAT